MNLARLAAAAGLGGALGAAARFLLADVLAPTSGFAWMTLTINIVGSAVLAGLPAVAVVRRSPWLPVFLGTGVLGGFTTMSAAVAVPLARHSALSATLYVGLTLGAALVAVRLVQYLTHTTAHTAAQVSFEAAGGEE